MRGVSESDRKKRSVSSSSTGREALKGIVPDNEYVDAFVVNEDHLGVWVSLPELPSVTAVVLLKWKQFSTAMLEYEPEVLTERSPVGFRR